MKRVNQASSLVLPLIFVIFLLFPLSVRAAGTLNISVFNDLQNQLYGFSGEDNPDYVTVLQATQTRYQIPFDIVISIHHNNALNYDFTSEPVHFFAKNSNGVYEEFSIPIGGTQNTTINVDGTSYQIYVFDERIDTLLNNERLRVNIRGGPYSRLYIPIKVEEIPVNIYDKDTNLLLDVGTIKGVKGSNYVIEYTNEEYVLSTGGNSPKGVIESNFKLGIEYLETIDILNGDFAVQTKIYRTYNEDGTWTLKIIHPTSGESRIKTASLADDIIFSDVEMQEFGFAQNLGITFIPQTVFNPASINLFYEKREDPSDPSPSDPSPSDPSPHKEGSPQPGDDNNVLVYFIMLIVTCAGMGLLIYALRPKKHDKNHIS